MTIVLIVITAVTLTHGHGLLLPLPQHHIDSVKDSYQP